MKIKTSKKLLKLLILIKTTILISSNVYAETLLTCDAPKGKGYYYQGPIISKKLAGWSDDGISKGSFSLIKNKDKFDILYKDASGSLVSSTADGGYVVPLGNNMKNYSFLVSYPNVTAELFTFNIKNKKLAYSQHKYGSSMMDKRVLFVANCL
tara:strand:- start:172 stop:630 length:459 start_codon:yes stop_codon:yes gene_type:complete